MTEAKTLHGIYITYMCTYVLLKCPELKTEELNIKLILTLNWQRVLEMRPAAYMGMYPYYPHHLYPY